MHRVVVCDAPKPRECLPHARRVLHTRAEQAGMTLPTERAVGPLSRSSRTNTHETAVDEEEEEEPAAAVELDSMVEDGEEQGQAIDREFHAQFWSLQAMFQSPQQMLAKPTFLKFQDTLTQVS
jgi:hypothetical protein